MTIERRLKTKRVDRRKVYSYRVKWRFKGVGDWQSRTVTNAGDAKALESALEARGWALFSTDAEVATLSIIGAPVEVPQEPANAALTLREAIKEWINRPGLGKGSRKTYTQVLRRLNKNTDLAHSPVNALTVKDISDWFRAQEDAKAAPNYLLHMQIVLKGSLARVGHADLMEEVDYKGGRKVHPHYLRPEQVDSLVEAARRRGGENLALAIRLTATCGLRWGETYGLRVRYIDAEGQMLHVEEGINNSTLLSEGWNPSVLKTLTSHRKVPLPADLAAHLQGRSGDGPAFRPELDPLRPRQANREAPFWSHRTFHYNWKKIVADAAGVPDDLRYHDLRHTAAKTWLERGVPIGIVSKMLGHSKIDVTHREYGGFDQNSMDLMRAAMER